MAQESGLAGIIPGRETAPFDPAKMMEFVVRMKEAKKQSVTQDLQTAMSLAEKGLIEPGDLEKKVKAWEQASGIKMADAGTVKAARTQPPVTSGQGAAIQAVGKAGMQPSGAQSGTPVTPQAAQRAPAGGIEPQMKGGGGFENYINQIRRAQQLSNLSAEKKAQAEIATDQLRAEGL